MSAEPRPGYIGGGKSAEAEVQRLINAGQTRRDIILNTEIAVAIIDRVINYNGDELRRRRVHCAAGSDGLRAAVLEECAAANNAGGTPDPFRPSAERSITKATTKCSSRRGSGCSKRAPSPQTASPAPTALSAVTSVAGISVRREA